jgi:hypothetical protein
LNDKIKYKRSYVKQNLCKQCVSLLCLFRYLFAKPLQRCHILSALIQTRRTANATNTNTTNSNSSRVKQYYPIKFHFFIKRWWLILPLSHPELYVVPLLASIKLNKFSNLLLLFKWLVGSYINLDYKFWISEKILTRFLILMYKFCRLYLSECWLKCQITTKQYCLSHRWMRFCLSTPHTTYQVGGRRPHSLSQRAASPKCAKRAHITIQFFFSPQEQYPDMLNAVILLIIYL